MTSSATRLLELFRGYSEYFGRYVTTEKNARGKLEGQAYTDMGECGVEQWVDHLNGKFGLGIIPLMDDNTVVWAGIDIDEYDLKIPLLVEQLEKEKAPFVVFRSKSGGAHVIAFFERPCPAETAVNWLKAWASFLGRGNCEVFPKQTSRLSPQDIGNWLNMPYQGDLAKPSLRYAVGPDGEALALEDALDLGESRKVDPDDLPEPEINENSDLFMGGPPCLQMLQKIGGFPEGHRNDGMFNVAVYLKKRFPDDWQDRLFKYNDEMCDPPIDNKEIRSSLMRSHERKEYSYKCKQAPIVSYCNRSQCLRQKFGVGSVPGSGGFEIDHITKYDGDPILWFLSVQGKRIMMTTAELLSPGKFTHACVEALTQVPPSYSQSRWTSYIAEKIKDADVIPAPLNEETMAGLLYTMLQQFCFKSNGAKTIEELAMDVPYHEGEYVYFKGQAFQSYLIRQNVRVGSTFKYVKHVLSESAPMELKKFKINKIWVNAYRVKKSYLQPEAPDEPPEQTESFSL